MNEPEKCISKENIPGKDGESMKPTYDELVEFARWAQKKQPEALEVWRKHGFVYNNDDMNDPIGRWQKLAFSHYTDLCEIESKVRHLFEDENDPL